MGKVEDVEKLAFELGCNIGSFPIEYLGPLGVKQKAARVWDGVEERFRRRLALRKRQRISKGRKLSYQKYPLQHAHLLNVSVSSP